MVFGVFDRLHPGHLSFLKQAKKYGEKLIVVVARDSAVFKLKNKSPNQNEKARLQNLRKLSFVTSIVLGDNKQGTYDVMKKHKPEIICLGYDQGRLLRDMRDKIKLGKIPQLKLIKLKSYHPRKFHSSLQK